MSAFVSKYELQFDGIINMEDEFLQTNYSDIFYKWSGAIRKKEIYFTWSNFILKYFYDGIRSSPKHVTVKNQNENKSNKGEN